MTRTRTASLLAFGLALALVLAACGASIVTPTPAPPTPASLAVVLPDDDAPHGFNTEWWYYNGNLRTDDGREFSFHYVVFQLDLPIFPSVSISHLSITDHQTREFITDQRQELGISTASGANGFDIAVGGWTMQGFDGADRISATANGYGFDLTLSTRTVPTLHGGSGLIPFGSAGESYYYSRTRMSVTGTMTLPQGATPVTGVAWFDHQWGDFTVQPLTWDWFALQLDDGSTLMLYDIRDDASADGVIKAGTFIAPDGSTTPLDADAFTTMPTGSWTSPVSGGVYPMGWSVQVPAHGIDITIEPTIRNAEFDATSTTFNYYWEGNVEVSGSHRGRGFVELVGYAESPLLGGTSTP